MIYGAEEKAKMALPRLHMNFEQHQDLCVQFHVLLFPSAPEPSTALPCSEALSKRIFLFFFFFRELLFHHKTPLQHKSGIRGSQMWQHPVDTLWSYHFLAVEKPHVHSGDDLCGRLGGRPWRSNYYNTERQKGFTCWGLICLDDFYEAVVSLAQNWAGFLNIHFPCAWLR